MNKLLQKPKTGIVVVEEPQLAACSQAQLTARQKLTKGIKLNVIFVLAGLLALVSMSALGPDMAFIGSYLLAAIPPMICAWVVYEAFHHFGMAVVTGVAIVFLMGYFGTITPFITTLRELLMSLSNIAGYLAGLVLAVMIGIALKR